jgi:uncharacterized protein (TIGR02270 family)
VDERHELAPARIIPDILEEHLDELDALWERREVLLFDYEWTVHDLAETEARADANLDGLLVAGEASAAQARAALEGDEVGLATAGAMMLLAFSPESRSEVVARLADAGEAVREGIRIALRHGRSEAILAELESLVEGDDPGVRIVAVDALAFHGRAPGGAARSLLQADDAVVRRLAIAAAGRTDDPWDQGDLAAALDSGDEALAGAALETSARRGLPGLAALCRERVQAGDVGSSLEFLAMVGGEGDGSVLHSLLANDEARPTALRALGIFGRVSAVPGLLSAISDPDPVVARAAGAAFARITGADILGTERPRPPEDLSEGEVDDWDDSPLPDPAKAAAFWEAEGGRFESGAVWQGGIDVSDRPAAADFNALTLESRRSVYLRQRALDPTWAADLEIEARATRQLAAARRLDEGD